MIVIDLVALANAARPIPNGRGDDDWGSERQIDAQNTFTDALFVILSAEQWDRFETYAHKANVDEMVDFGLELAAEHAGVA